MEEGVELFEETMAKMQEANSDNQREKFQVYFLLKTYKPEENLLDENLENLNLCRIFLLQICCIFSLILLFEDFTVLIYQSNHVPKKNISG